mgnify:CR=1 FL=1
MKASSPASRFRASRAALRAVLCRLLLTRWSRSLATASKLVAGSWQLVAGSYYEIRCCRLPGSNCDHDAYHAARHVLGQEAEFVWHKETSPQGRGRRDPARRVLAR